MEVKEFFEIFLEELKQNPALHKYYKFLGESSSFEFRKAYFCQRLQYIIDNIENKNANIWDCGCGYGTTDIFLAINGIKTFGSTLEFYYKEIPKRLEFYSKYGDMSLFTYSYENLFDQCPPPNSHDIVILQDTLHHLEPLQDALKIFKSVLKPEGKIILVEENGNNSIQNLKLYLRRGNKRIIEIYDDRLKKNILIGNENIRSHKAWSTELEKENFYIKPDKTNYIRLYPPLFYKKDNIDSIIEKEQRIWKTNAFLREKFFFGLNMIVVNK